jgi:O-methyltransferase
MDINIFKKTVKHFLIAGKSFFTNIKYSSVFSKYKEFTMIPDYLYCYNLEVSEKFKNVKGCIVECGVWRGGMSAGLVDIMGSDRNYYLFDSFEGLPPAKEIDGDSAIEWQKNTDKAGYFDNCKAEMSFAENVMKKSGATNYFLIKGWFNETFPVTEINEPIAILRLDGDWYDSIMDSMKYWYPKLTKGGLILLDDYATWDGCSKAIHDYLSEHKLADRIYQWQNSKLYYIIKE